MSNKYALGSTLNQLTFSVGEVRRLLDHTLAAAEHRPSFAELFDPLCHKGGKIKHTDGSTDCPDSENIDQTMVPAGLWLVKDQGVYLMSNGSPGFLKEGQDPSAKFPSHFVSYADEANPKTVEDWWEVSRAIMGGDDCVVPLPAKVFSDVQKLNDDDQVILDVAPDTVAVSFVRKNQTPRPKG